jgi:hypothetical protein
MFFEALFKPSKKKGYTADMQRLIGKRIPLQGGWVADDGPHKGRQCFYVANLNDSLIPADDLKDLENISFAKWKQGQTQIETTDK